MEEIARVELVNYTPVLLGGFNGNTFIRVGERLAAIGNPSKQVIGRSRWLLRVLVASLGAASSHKDAEKWPCDKSDKRHVKCLGLPELIYGSIDPAWKALYTVQTTYTIGDNPVDYEVVRNLSLSRYNLVTINIEEASEDALFKAPIRPGSLRLTVRVLRRSVSGTSEIYPPPWLAGDVEALDSLALLLPLTVLRLIGIGQGANRGFGRFTINNINNIKYGVAAEARIVLKMLRELDSNKSSSEALNDVKNIFNNLKSMVKKLVVPEALMKASSGSPEDYGVPILDIENFRMYSRSDNVDRRLDDIWSKLPKQMRKSDSISSLEGVYWALEAIGLATLKMSWKNLNREGRAGGGAYHTWILGLPRRQKIVKYNKCFGSSDDPPTGYLVKADEKEKGKKIRLKRLSSNDEIFIVSSSGSVIFVEGRRQSSIILFPLNERGSLIAAITFKPMDLNSLVDKLYHAGGLARTKRVRRNREVKTVIEFTDVIRLARVVDIASQGSKRVKANCRRQITYANDSVRGVAEPGRRTHPYRGGSARDVEKHRLVEEAYLAALKFLDKLLG